MSLTKKQKLFIHNVLFHQMISTYSEVNEEIQDILNVLESEILEDLTEAESLRTAGMSVIYSDENEDDLDFKAGERFLRIEEACNLDPVLVYDSDSLSSFKLDFFINGKKLGADLLNARTSEIEETIEDVRWITRTGRELFLGLPSPRQHSRIFSISKFPKTWTSVLDVRNKYLIK